MVYAWVCPKDLFKNIGCISTRYVLSQVSHRGLVPLMEISIMHRIAPWMHIKPVTDSRSSFFLLGAAWLVRWQGSGADVPFQGLQMLFEAAGKQHLLKHLTLI